MLFGIRVSLPIRPTSLKGKKKALRIILGTDYILYANALDVCDVDRLSGRREQHSLKFAQSLPKCSRTSKLLPPCRGEIHGRQLRNNAKLTQPRARTNRYACSPIPYYVELINSKLPLLDFLLSIFFFACCFTVWPCFSVVYCCTFFKLCFWSYCVLFLLSYIVLCNSALGPRFCANKMISYHIILFNKLMK